MAGAGKKTFVAGEVLTAAQVNDYLMDQAVMRFSGSAARAASITAPTEGMVTYLDDSNVLEYYDGSAWVNVVPQSEIDGKIAASLFTASAQVLISAGSASVVALGGAAEGQVLTAASAQPNGVAWVTPAGAGEAGWANITAASTNTAFTKTLPSGFYKITTNSSLSYTSAEFRFVDSGSLFYGASLTNGAGFFSLPVDAASVNVTKGAPMTVLVEEISSLTEALLPGPTITDSGFVNLTTASFTASTAAGATNLGVFHSDTGSLAVLAASVTTASFISSVSASPTSIDNPVNVTYVQRGSNGLWSLSTTASAYYPFKIFTGNDTYVPPVWSASTEVVVVAGGGAGGGDATFARTGGGGAGGVLQFTEANSGSVAIVVGAGGTGTNGRGPNGSDSSYGASVAIGGGGGGTYNSGGTNDSGKSGGSGGGPGERTYPGGAGTPGQGNDAGAGVANANGGGGGGASAAGSAQNGGDGISVYGLTVAGGGGAAWDNGPFPINLGNNGAGQNSFGGGGAGFFANTVTGGTGGSGKPGAVIIKALP
jgi:hypothetical protein